MYMKKIMFTCGVLFVILTGLSAWGQTTTYHVTTSGNDGVSGADWSTALLTIGKAVEKAATGDEILVSNGVYGITQQISITKGIALHSVNGPEETTIKRLSGTDRILYLSNVTAVVSGFTIRDGTQPAKSSMLGGGILIDAYGTVSNCVITANKLPQNSSGGGVALRNGGTVRDCKIINNLNVSWSGAGVYLQKGGLVENCVISNNTTTGNGFAGGAYLLDGGTLRNCLVFGNSCANIFMDTSTVYYPSAGGVVCKNGGRVENCTIVGNFGNAAGGVACNGGGAIVNSIIYDNTTTGFDDPNYVNIKTGWSYTNSCTTPSVIGTGNITDAPQLIDPVTGNLRLLPGSPCIDAGAYQDWMDDSVDLDGRMRILHTHADMGAYEYEIGALVCNAIGAPPLTTCISNRVIFTAEVTGTNTTGLYYKWDFQNDTVMDAEGADRRVVTNLYLPGLYSVRLVVTNIAGEVAEQMRPNYVKVGPETAYVATNTTPVYPYESWSTAAASIQEAVDAGVDGTTVLVSNGVYDITSQVDLLQGIAVRSVNGYSNTVVSRKSGTTRIFHLAHPEAVVDGFTVINGHLSANGSKGGGMLIDKYGSVSNCLITGNRVTGNAYGGGVCLNLGGTVHNCRLIGNLGSWSGGGVYAASGGTIENCVIAENTGDGNGGGGGSGAGAYVTGGALLRNCLVYNNVHTPGKWSAKPEEAGGVYCGANGRVENCTIVSNSAVMTGGLRLEGNGVVMNSIVALNMSSTPGAENYSNVGTTWSYTNCLTDPLISSGLGNIAGDPLFVNASASDYRLQRTSPARNAGKKQDWMEDATDLWGFPRIDHKVVDIGAYEGPYLSLGTSILVR